MPRHVVLPRRDPSLGLALRALLHGPGRVTELLTVPAWSAPPAGTVPARTPVAQTPPAVRRHGQPSGNEPAHRLRVDAMFLFQHAGRQAVFVIVGLHRHHGLDDTARPGPRGGPAADRPGLGPAQRVVERRPQLRRYRGRRRGLATRRVDRRSLRLPRPERETCWAPPARATRASSPGSAPPRATYHSSDCAAFCFSPASSQRPAWSRCASRS